MSALLLCSCDRSTIYSSAYTLPASGWDMDSAVHFDFKVNEPATAYDVVIFVRHRDNYPYQNMWLIVENMPSATADTIEFYLADQRGRWLGSGMGKTKQMPVLYEQNYHFADSCCSMSIRHAMRDETLHGVSDIGLRITKSEGQ